MNEDTKKKVMLVVTLACVALAIGIVYWTTFRGKGTSSSSKGLIYLKCMNKECGKTTEISIKKFQALLQLLILWDGLMLMQWGGNDYIDADDLSVMFDYWLQ